jgi:hypothetical protein
MSKQYNPQLTEAIEDVLDEFPDTYGKAFVRLIAALRIHGFSIYRADEATEVIISGTDLWSELGCPSILFYSKSAPTGKWRDSEPGSDEYAYLLDKVLRANLAERRHLLALLEAFYAQHTPVSFTARLIVGMYDSTKPILQSQGAGTRLLLDETKQRAELEDYMREFDAFGEFLASYPVASSNVSA